MWNSGAVSRNAAVVARHCQSLLGHQFQSEIRVLSRSWSWIWRDENSKCEDHPTNHLLSSLSPLQACRAIQPMYYRLANMFTNVIFVEVPVTEDNAALHQGLGVPSLPYSHIYEPNTGLVEELKISRQHISDFANKLQSYVTGACELKDLSTTSPYHSEEGEE